MSDTDKPTNLLLDSVWPSIDVKGTGYIYGKDFPLAVSKMEELLSKGQGISERTSLVSKTGQEILKKFSSDQEFFKVYKEDFAELFNGLLGTSFKTAVQTCTEDKSLDFIRAAREMASFHENEDTPVDSETIRSEVVGLKAQIDELRRQNLEKDRTIAAKDAILFDLQSTGASAPGSPITERGLRNLRTRIANLTEDLQGKDDVIRDKDRELLSLTKKVGEYRDKYQFLEREFQFYKDHGELQKPESTKEATKHEFIISELRRKINDQGDMINAMRAQVGSKQIFLPTTSKTGPESSILDAIPVRKTLKWIAVVVMVVLGANIFLFFVASMKSAFGTDSSSAINPQIQLEWWERMPVFSKIGWFFSEYLEHDWASTSDDEISSNYDKIFGV
ncbi:LAME_0B04060g1_1 [Lachancea meyersii CBS 8951]|uniref:Monopolar spindle protein 2 n=1 Tax=Lachancea meyersii CBS 8951 TaxID=1266667 RepID=A0A1G4IUG3_9SACH|nr:LAME_0B04060g1_1 [Lachancea meyersii CBS 8951]